ncbi:MAG: recombinase family protein [Lachnospiraceae bacterium]|nr:recombinase family protein [Lachnospiraceae bacterium]
MAKKKGKITALYERLSHDDEQQGESMSISNQKRILEDYAERMGLANIVHFTDDGISGLRFDRPGFVALINEVEAGNVETVIIKDMSRFGRDYLQVGNYTEFLRKKGVRLIALNDSVDTLHGEDEFAPFRNIMNEWYARDTSKKIRSAYQAKNLAGKHTSSSVPYGYLKSETDKNQWIIDPVAAGIVRRIFAMCMDGKGPYQISKILTEEKVEIPAYYHQKKGIGLWKTREIKNPYQWGSTTIVHILENPCYLGHTVNFRTRKHFKDKKSHYVDKDQWTIIPNTHEAIIDQETFDNVQRLRGNIRRYPDGWGEAHPLSGLMYCADCGAKMYVHRINNGKRIPQFTCSAYTKVPVGVLCKTQHRINADVVMKLIAETLKEIVKFSEEDEEAFREAVFQATASHQDQDMIDKKMRLLVCQKRADELEKLICRAYEENTLGRMPDERYRMLTAQYSGEQDELKKEMETLQAVLGGDDASDKSEAKFMALVKKYQGFEEMTNTMLNEFVQKVVVHEREQKGVRTSPQTIEIYFNFIGQFQTPDSSVALTAEQQEVNQELMAQREALHQKNREAYLKRRASGKDQAYYEKNKQKWKETRDAAKEIIRAEDMAQGIFTMPNQVILSGSKTQ